MLLILSTTGLIFPDLFFYDIIQWWYGLDIAVYDSKTNTGCINIEHCFIQDVKFSMNLDVYDLCTEELQKKLMPVREKFKEEEDRQTEALTKVRIDLYPNSLETSLKLTHRQMT